MSDSRRVGLTTVTKKFIIALSGFGLVAFVILHLLGNLSLYCSQGIHFNAYAAKLEGFGSLLTVAEIGLLLVFLVHIGSALGSKKKNLDARPERYRAWKSKGGETPSNLSSRTMAISVILILAFVVIHVWQFRFGAGLAQGYAVTAENGKEEIRDLYRLVVEILKNPAWASFYVVAMILLGIHLRHGVWSAFQSMGWTSRRMNRNFRIVCSVLGVILAVGFLFIPVWIYFGIQR